MAKEIMHPSMTTPHAAGFDVVTPLSSRTLFWRPRFMRDTASLHHLPFLFWLVDTLRPKSFVSLGGGDGVVHFAMCQAAEKLDLDARGYSFGPWAGEAGTVPADLAHYNAENYPDSSRLSASAPHQAASGFPGGSIDLLSVHLPEDEADQGLRLVDAIDRDWLHRMSSRGVILLHNANRLFEHGNNSGALAELIGVHPGFHLDTGTGMLLILRGKEPVERLSRLCNMNIGEPGYAAVLQIFGRLGSAIRAEMSARDAEKHAEDLAQRVELAERDLAQSRKAETEGRASLERLNAAYDERSRKVAVLQAKLVDLQLSQSDQIAAQKEQSEKLAAMSAREMELAAQLARNTTAFADLDKLKEEAETLRSKQSWLRQERERLLSENKELTAAKVAADEASKSRIVELETLLSTLKAQTESAHDATTAEVARLTAALESSEASAKAHAAESEALKLELGSQTEATNMLTRQLETAAINLDARNAEWASLRGDMERQLRALAAERDALEPDLEAALSKVRELEDALATAHEQLSQVRQEQEREQAETAARLTQHRQDLQKLTSALEVSQVASETKCKELQAKVDALSHQLAEAQEAESKVLKTLTTGFEARQIAVEEQREEMLRELRQLREDLEQARTENAALVAMQKTNEQNFVQARSLLESDVEGLQALLRDQLALVGKLRLEGKENKERQETLRKEREAAREHAKALDDVISQLLSSTSWKLTAPMRKLLETVRRH